MNINFDDENLIVTNLQIFLKETVDPMLVLSGCYDTSTHQALINYLKQPNTADFREVVDGVINNFTYKESYAPFTLIDGGGIYNFDVETTCEKLTYTTRPTIASYNNGVAFIADHIEELSKFVSNLGWSVTDYTYSADDGTNSGRTRAQIIVERTGIVNVLPHKDVISMVNLFTGNYLYKRCITAADKFKGFIQTHSAYKLAYIPCSPGDTFTIAHGFAIPCEMAVGYCTCTARDLKTEDTQVLEVESRMVSDGGVVKPGDYFYYEVPENSNATFLLVQLPYRDNLTAVANETLRIALGDVNQDGVVDAADVSVLEAYVAALEANETPPISLEGSALIAANVTRNVDLDGNPIISRDDVVVLQNAVSSGKTEELGVYEYEQARTVSQFELDRLLIMSGELAKDEDLHIPVEQFWKEPWAVHSKFLEYFLGRVIHTYSSVDDIAWLQKNIMQLYPDYDYRKLGSYDDENDYITGDFIKRNNLSGNWEYFKNGENTGYYMESYHNLKNGIFKRVDGVFIDMKIVDSNIYVDDRLDGRVVLSSGKIATKGVGRSLRACVKDFQKAKMHQLTALNAPEQFQRCWTIGFYDVATDEMLMKTLGADVIHTVSAFR